MSSSDELTLPAAPTRYLSPRRAARQAARTAHRQEVAAGLKFGFGRAVRRHPDPTPNLPDKDKQDDYVWVDVVIDHPTKRTSQLKINCLDCGELGFEPSRRRALNACHAHLQTKHAGIVGRIRRDIV